jgi:hypothetical protein
MNPQAFSRIQAQTGSSRRRGFNRKPVWLQRQIGMEMLDMHISSYELV